MNYPIGMQSFCQIRKNGYLYVDKTALVHRLVGGGRYYFLSRPRRFGKSLLVSTLDAYFTGRKELFTGLAIERLERSWTVHPVLHIDLNGGDYTKPGELERMFNRMFTEWEKLYGSDKAETTLPLRFGGIIRRAAEQTGQGTVVLVDEYDKPLLQNIGHAARRDELRNEMKAVFSQLKTQDRYIRFAFLTGVTKFSKVSVFSDLNNLADITLNPFYETLCGISQDEVDCYFAESLHELAEANGYSFEQAKNKLAQKYDGYHFSRLLTDIYNPFSILNAFAAMSYGNYWFETGTPTFLIELLRKNDIAIDSLGQMEMSDRDLGNVDALQKNPIPVLFQSGYLTIKDYGRDEELYTLGFPNEEVTDGFFKMLLPYYANVDEVGMSSIVSNLRKAIQNADIDTFMLILQSFFAGYDYSLIPRHDLERHYQNVIYAVCKLIGLRVTAEYHTSNGRIDMLIETVDAVFIFEFKLNVSTGRALRQIAQKDYAAQFATDSRKVYKIGVNFDSTIRGIKDWEVQTHCSGC